MRTESLRPRFGQLAGEEYHPLIPFAVNRRTGQIVRLPNEDYLHDGTETFYDPDVHKGLLDCPHCDAHIHYEPARGKTLGDNMRQTRERFATNAGEKHDADCEIGMQRNHQKRDSNIDTKRGYKVGLNMLTGPEQKRAKYDFTIVNPYDPEQATNHTIPRTQIRTDPDILKMMESFPVSDIKDLIRFLGTKDQDRISGSVILHRNNEILWRHFLIAYGDHAARFKGLLGGFGRKGQQPVLMEILANAGPQGRNNRVVSLPMSDEYVEDGKPVIIQPSVYVDNPELIETFKDGGRFLVLGFVRNRLVRNESEDIYYLSMSVTDPAQVAKVAIDDLKAQNTLHHQKRAAVHAALDLVAA